jgi:hypothetical protein
MPMLPGYEDIRACVATSAAEAGLTMNRLEVELPDPDWLNWVALSISSCDFVVVDLSDHNPFVMYELGLTHAAKKPTIYILNETNTQATATISGSYFLPYNIKRLDVFAQHLASMMLDTSLALRGRTTNSPIVNCPNFIYTLADGWYRSIKTAHPETQRVPEECVRASITVGIRRGEFFFDLLDRNYCGLMTLPRIVERSLKPDVMKTIIRHVRSEARADTSSASQ